VRFRVRLRSGR
jgi:hypothetical protein